MFFNITKLQNRFFLCYLFAVFIPIMLLSSMIYYYHSNQRAKDYITEKKNSLIIEQNYLESQLDSSSNYFNQLKSNYELQSMLKEFYTTEREIVYAYNSQIYSLISSIFLYDSNISGITLYTQNTNAANILNYFEPMSACPVYEDFQAELIDGFWKAEEEKDGAGFSFYIGFSNPPSAAFPGIVKLSYNHNIFSSCEADSPESSVYVFLNGRPIYRSNDAPEASACLEAHEQQLLAQTQADAPQVILDGKSRSIISAISLDNGIFHVIRVTPETGNIFSYQPFLLSLAISVLILGSASIIIFCLIFKPLKNIVRLSEHMNRQNSHTLSLYPGKISRDETGDLILSFNRMSERINELSESLLNNEIQLKNAQIEALQNQLNPHFFYGTLESIRMIAEANHQELISDIAYSFGNLMRYSLSREYLVPVSREIEMTRQYVSIQEKRLVNRFEISWDICELDDKWRCPKFALFNMVENVFSHNVSKCRSFIQAAVILKKDGDDLIITVKNTGPGIPPERLAHLRYLLEHPRERDTMTSENNGRGIFNINDRLRLFYGGDYRLDIDSEENVLTVCSVRICKHYNGF
ncbi:sensor histidine kinase [Eisenbergiella massiliensis]|uniref:sensor histidine kinase n=2 Tax=Eisenbergiella TaxID=1432051 RepID=UPI003996AD79